MKTLVHIFMIVLAMSPFSMTVKGQNFSGRTSFVKRAARETPDLESLSSQYVQGVITIKLREGVGEFGKQTGTVRFGIQSLDSKVADFQVNRLDKRFKFNPAKMRAGLPDLSRIYKISFPENISLTEVVKAFSSDPNVEYAEPVPVYHTADVPDDALYSQMQHLPQIFAEQAWAIHKGENGSEEIVTAIVDTGVEWDHLDLQSNVWQNMGEDADGDGHTIELSGLQWELDPGDLNGVDNDGNGFTDDLLGWNFITNNGDPSPIPGNPIGYHGTHCAGISNGATNNGRGIASISWNLSFMAICTDQDNSLPYAFDGIIYAAENGADIISNSWGGGPYSAADQEVVNYAAGLGSIILAAAHNQNMSASVYPADYQNVISVASVNGDDTKAPYSNYNLAVDLAAPGGGTEGGILSTIPGNAYELASGTSMATPLVAGCFGLLKSYHPDWTNEQLITQLLGTADNIDSLNPDYLNMLGSGRVNAYRMLAEENVTMPFLKLGLTSVDPVDENGDGINEPGENVTLNFKLQNYIQCTGSDNVSFSITTEDPEITITDGTGSVNIPADSSFSIQDQLQIQIGLNALCHFANLTLHFESDLQILAGQDINFSVSVNPSGILVFEGEKNGRDYSGKFISDFLDHLGFEYTYTNDFPQLKGFETVFLSFGNPGQNLDKGTPLTQNNASVLQEYLLDGENVYLEKGGLFYSVYYYPNRDTIKQLLGVNAFNWTELENPIDTLNGVANTPTAGMIFAGSDQVFNWHIDRVTPATGAFITFKERNYGTGNVAIMYNGSATYGQKSFYMGYTLADLHDKDAGSSRNNVLLKTMDFFGYDRPQGYLLSNFITNKKAGGAPLQVQFTDISISDTEYPITSWQWDFNNDGSIESTDQNPVWTYNDAGEHDVKLIASNGLKSDTLIIEGLITVNSGILVYEGVAGGTDYSGSFIRDYLQVKTAQVTYQNEFPESLEGFSSAFLSYSNWNAGSTALDDQMAAIIIDYLETGGFVYLEGGDVFGWDQPDNVPFLESFGLVSATDGSENPIDSLLGQSTSLTNEMLFTGNSQASNSWIDIYEPSPDAFAAFIESNYGTVAVQRTAPDGRRTFCFSYSLADLTDGEFPNTREELLNRILNFFDIHTAVPKRDKSGAMRCKIYPNPMKTEATLQYYLPEANHTIIEIFNSTGQQIMQPLNSNQSEGEHIIHWDAGGLHAGIYFYTIRSGNLFQTGKIIVLN